MYVFLIGLVLVAFQVTCDGAPGRSLPVPELPSNVTQEEEQIEKRTCKSFLQHITKQPVYLENVRIVTVNLCVCVFVFFSNNSLVK